MCSSPGYLTSRVSAMHSHLNLLNNVCQFTLRRHHTGVSFSPMFSFYDKKTPFDRDCLSLNKCSKLMSLFCHIALTKIKVSRLSKIIKWGRNVLGRHDVVPTSAPRIRSMDVQKKNDGLMNKSKATSLCY